MSHAPRSNDIGFMIKMIHDDIDRIINNELRPFDLTSSQIVVLTYLSSHEGSEVTISDLQKHLGVAHPTVVGLINRLEKKELVETYTPSNDHRMRIVRLTDKARELLQGFPSKDTVESRLLSGLSDAELQELQRLLGILKKNVE